MVEVFKTNVEELIDADNLIALLKNHFKESRINFDMHDCDRILRLEGDNIIVANVISIVRGAGFTCNSLD